MMKRKNAEALDDGKLRNNRSGSFPLSLSPFTRSIRSTPLDAEIDDTPQTTFTNAIYRREIEEDWKEEEDDDDG